MLYWYLRIRNFLEEQKGQDLAEYALLIALIAIVVAAAVGPLGNTIKAVFENINNEFSTTP